MTPEGTAMRRGVFFDRDASPGRIGRGKAALIESIFAGGGAGPSCGEHFVKISETPVLAVPQNRRMIGE